ncbi:MAG: hypothetical protein HYX63_03190 [Gammaproteobacteria bacterium]|nr:hypothetical protein [Gammaproteobacteria bacterium]
MNPSIDLRLRSMMRAITEVIMPAVDPQNSLAQEQIRLLLGHLHALSLQVTHAPRLAAIELNELQQLARELLTHAVGGPATQRAAARVTALVGGSDHAALAHAVEALLIASGEDGGAEFKNDAETRVLAFSRAEVLRGRAWFKAMGFDTNPERLPDIPTLLAAYDRTKEIS